MYAKKSLQQLSKLRTFKVRFRLHTINGDREIKNMFTFINRNQMHEYYPIAI